MTAGIDLAAGDAPLPHYLTVDQAASVLGVDRKTLYAAVKTGSVPGVVKVGRRYCIRTSALLPHAEGKARPDGAVR